jgi:hypothetical protein
METPKTLNLPEGEFIRADLFYEALDTLLSLRDYGGPAEPLYRYEDEYIKAENRATALINEWDAWMREREEGSAS